ncbi:MAG TPA: hypothetical protein VFF73_35045 [Planctomycetota bacterium]|nr:hypothetical protein [Planctomycetota bacterium]
MSIPVAPTNRGYAFEHVFTAPEGSCRVCGRALQITQWRGRRVERVDGCHKLVMRDRRCPDAACPGHAEIRRPPEEHRFALKKDLYGLDLLFEIADRRAFQRMGLEEIRTLLAGRGLEVSLKTVAGATKRLSKLGQISEGALAGLREQGRLVVMIDVVSYAVGSPVLYLAIDAVSRTVLHAERRPAPSEEAFARVLERVGAVGVPVEAFVTDGANGGAIEAAFPGVPHRRFASDAVATPAPAEKNACAASSATKRILAVAEQADEAEAALRDYADDYSSRSSWE